MTHPTWQLNVLENGAALILTPCPGTKGEDLKTSLERLKVQGAEAIVTALQNSEMEQAAVTELPVIAEQLGLKWYHQPIEDDHAPDEEFAECWKITGPKVHKVLQSGGKVVLHCMGGAGRTGLLAAHILLELGWKADTIKSEVQALRPGAFTKPVQIEYLQKISNSDITLSLY